MIKKRREEHVVKYAVLLEWDEESQVFVTYVPALGNISTYGETEQAALDATKEMIEGYLEAAGQDPGEGPRYPPKLVEIAVG